MTLSVCTKLSPMKSKQLQQCCGSQRRVGGATTVFLRLSACRNDAYLNIDHCYTDVERWSALGRVFVDVCDAEYGRSRVAETIHQSGNDEEVECRLCARRLLNVVTGCGRLIRPVSPIKCGIIGVRPLTEFRTICCRSGVVCFHIKQKFHVW